MRRAVFRVVDTGLNSPDVNLAMDRSWLLGHALGERDNLLRFHRSTPSAWLGLQQWPERELRLGYCRRKGIEVLRRLTGGGTLFIDAHQLGFSLILKWTERLAAEGEAGVLRRAGEALAAALQSFGVPAQFQAPNDVTVHGRKLASVFSGRFRGSVLVQGVLLLTLDATRLLNSLRLPSEPATDALGPHPARERLTALDAVCGRSPTPARLRKALSEALATAFNLRAVASTKTIYAELREPQPAAAGSGLDRAGAISTEGRYWREQEKATADLAEALWRTPAGLLRARLRWDNLQRAPLWLELGGNVQVYPLDLFARLAQALTGSAADALDDTVRRVCREQHAQFTGFTVEDLLAVLTRAWARAGQQRNFGLTVHQANRLTVVAAPECAANAAQLVQEADTVLLPYCARPPECRDQPLLTELRERGSRGVVGMTCQTFFIKHGDVFERAGLPVLLLDISGTTCYDHQQEAAGYSGRFPGKTVLDVPVFEKLLRLRAPVDAEAETVQAASA
jgi:lipoate-protein ligase A